MNMLFIGVHLIIKLSQALQKITDEPVVIKPQVLFLHKKLRALAIDEQKVDNYLLAVQLLAMAISLHEELQEKNSILVGDYYSAHAYMLLAEDPIILEALMQEMALIHQSKVAEGLEAKFCSDDRYLSRLEFGLAKALLNKLCVYRSCL